VAVVGPNNKVSIHSVTPGLRVGSLWVIDSGLSPGDVVVTEGLVKAQDGGTVTPKAEQIPQDGNQASAQ
jgi:membrane fusion protein, multidrug efflux system